MTHSSSTNFALCCVLSVFSRFAITITLDIERTIPDLGLLREQGGPINVARSGFDDLRHVVRDIAPVLVFSSILIRIESSACGKEGVDPYLSSVSRC